MKGTIHLRRRQIWPIFDSSPLENADVLNGWSQSNSIYNILTLFFFAESSTYLPEQFEESVEVESYFFCIKCDLRRRQDEGVDLELISIFSISEFSISSVSSKPASNENGLLCLCLTSGITCAEKLVKFIFHIFVNIIEFVTNSSDCFTNSVTTNLRIFSTKMNVVIHINST